MSAATAQIPRFSEADSGLARSCSWPQILAILEQHGFSGAEYILQRADPEEIKDRLAEEWAAVANKS